MRVKKLVKQKNLGKAEKVKEAEKRKNDWLHWITTTLLIKRIVERQELERLRELDVQLLLNDLKDLERQSEEQNRIEIMERMQQTPSREGWTGCYSKYRVDSLEVMEGRKDLEFIDRLKREELDVAALKESFAQQDQEKDKLDEYEAEKLILKMLKWFKDGKLEEELRREKNKLQKSPVQINVRGTQMQHKIDEGRFGEHLKESGAKKWKFKCKMLERQLVTQIKMAEAREMAMLNTIKKKREQEETDLERQMEKVLEEKRKECEIAKTKRNEHLRKQEEIQSKTEEKIEIKSEQEKRQRNLLPELLPEVEKQREKGELKRDFKLLKTRKSSLKHECETMHLKIQKEIEDDNLKKELNKREKEKEMENGKIAENRAINQKCKWMEMQFDKKMQVMEEKDGILEKKDNTEENCRHYEVRKLIEKERKIEGELQMNKSEMKRDNQKVFVTEQEEKPRTMDDHFLLPKSEKIKNLLHKSKERFKLESERQSKMNERTQSKEELLLGTKTEREKDQRNERQGKGLQIQQMEEPKLSDAEIHAKHQRDLLQEWFPQADSQTNQSKKDCLLEAKTKKEEEQTNKREGRRLTYQQMQKPRSSDSEIHAKHQRDLLQEWFSPTNCQTNKTTEDLCLQTETETEEELKNERQRRGFQIQQIKEPRLGHTKIHTNHQRDLLQEWFPRINGQTNQPKEDLLLETKKEREKEQRNERQRRRLPIQQMQEPRLNNSKICAKCQTDLLQEWFPRTDDQTNQTKKGWPLETKKEREKEQRNKRQGRQLQIEQMQKTLLNDAEVHAKLQRDRLQEWFPWRDGPSWRKREIGARR
ncbi:uncharacterized protein Hap1MRO34_023325 isoform 1-T1 [Clarias gariepinus]